MQSDPQLNHTQQLTLGKKAADIVTQLLILVTMKVTFRWVAGD